MWYWFIFEEEERDLIIQIGLSKGWSAFVLVMSGCCNKNSSLLGSSNKHSFLEVLKAEESKIFWNFIGKMKMIKHLFPIQCYWCMHVGGRVPITEAIKRCVPVCCISTKLESWSRDKTQALQNGICACPYTNLDFECWLFVS